MEPTEEGKRRYPPDGYYTVMVTPGTPGTCTLTCNEYCTGSAVARRAAKPTVTLVWSNVTRFDLGADFRRIRHATDRR